MSDDADRIAALEEEAEAAKGRRPKADADRLQDRRMSSEKPVDRAVVAWDATKKKFRPMAGVLDADPDTVDVENTTDEETVYSFTIPADTIGATGGVKVRITGDILCDYAGDLTLRVKLGATTVLSPNPVTLANTSARYSFELNIYIVNSAVDAQKCGGTFFAAVVSGANFDIALSSGNFAVTGAGVGSSAEDTTGDLLLDITAQWSAASANLSFRKEIAVLERIGVSAGGGAHDHVEYLTTDGERALTGTQVGIFPTASAHLATKEYVDSAIHFIEDYYFNNTASSYAGVYYKMLDTPTGEGESTFQSGALGEGDNQTLFNFATDAGAPGVTVLEAGTYSAHIHARVTAANKRPVKIHFKVYYRENGNEELVVTSEESAFLTTNSTEYGLHGTLAADVTIATTDRLIVKWFANVDAIPAVDAVVELFAEGENASRFSVPITTAVLNQIFLRQDGTKPLLADWAIGTKNITNIKSLFFDEQAAADADVAGDGQSWVHNETPNKAMFTDDEGTDFRVTGSVPLTCFIDGGGSDITTGIKCWFRIWGNWEVESWSLGGDNAANEIVLDVWQDTHANYPATVADTMVGGGNTKPTLSGAIVAEDDPTDWDTTVLTNGSWLFINVDSVGGTEPQKLALTLRVRPV